MAIKDSVKALLKTTEGAIVLGGLALTVLSPLFSPEIWAIGTGIAYLIVNVPAIGSFLKGLVKKKSGDTD